MTSRPIKRFYKRAEAAPAGPAFSVRLDGRPVRTPAGRPLEVPTQALAEAIAAEWEAQGTEVKPHHMPLTQLASTALDRIGPEREAILAQLMNYAATDLLCYRAGFPPDLVERQARQWQPLLDWARDALGADLVATEGVIAVAQPEPALAALAARLRGYDTWRLTALQMTAAAAGSLVLALALVEGRLGADQAFALSQLDETYQIEQWGEDHEAADRRATLARDIAAAGRLLTLAAG
ncbi:ATP12 family chaperone protein [Magnetospirillum sp. UT-4]|uniref:ATP12 family chaperone protein n=1 Tax=Magnetospirillum sp. UT-4 TaxID=2681467 RepID=UPI0013801AF4|nr:ATP12 family protein [Magnetospirillum sp. UT-4]CAA7616663.1 Chaperone [Magnetospirillum sp. UT-4]